MLASWHMTPTASPTPNRRREALRRTDDGAASRFDVVILDGQMPDVDGFMLARRIRTRPATRTHADRDADVGRARRQIGSPAARGRRRVPDQAGQALGSARCARHHRSACRRGTRRGAERAAAAPGAQAAAARCGFCVAEDNPVNRKLVTTLLQKRGHHVKAVENGRARASTTSCRRPADRSTSVLMDLQMPEMSGFEATQAIRAARARSAAAPADRRAHRPRDAGRSRALPRGRDGRLSVEADRRERSHRDRRAIRRAGEVTAAGAPAQHARRRRSPSSTSRRR